MLYFIITLIIFLALSVRVGGRRFPALPLFARSALGGLVMLVLATVIGSVLFALAGHFGAVAKSLTVIVTALIAYVTPLRPLEPHEDEREDPHAVSFFSSLALGIAVLALDVAIIWIFYRSRTWDPIPSPWTVAPHEVFYLFPLAMLGAMVVARRARLANFSYLVTAVTLATALLPAFLLYPLGFSFDAALHRAAESVIATTGAIRPLPIFYLGEYTLMSLLGRLTSIPIDLIGRLFVPLLTAATVPALVMLSIPPLSGGGKPLIGGSTRASARAAATLFLLVPFGELVMTLPQGLANLFAFAAFASGIATLTSRRTMRLPILFGLAAAATHPLTGIPVMIFLIVMWIVVRGSRRLHPAMPTPAKAGGYILLFLLGSVSLPLAFLVNAKRDAIFALGTQGHSLGYIFSQIFTIESVHLRRYDLIFDTLYRYGAMLPLIVVILALTATVARERNDRGNLIRVYGTTAAILAINFIILKHIIRFDFLPAFEQGNYSARLFSVILLLLLPLALMGLARVFDALPRTRLAPRAVLMITLALAATATIYLSYPRFDAYASNHGRNTSRYDLEAVAWIHNDGGADRYVVLAPPPTSAAALMRYGFWAYYPECPPATLSEVKGLPTTNASCNGAPLFYYPLPVAGPLYQSYVELVEEGVTIDAIDAVRARTSVRRVYLTIPNYWTRAAEAITEAKGLATRWTDISRGNIHVFVFE